MYVFHFTKYFRGQFSMYHLVFATVVLSADIIVCSSGMLKFIFRQIAFLDVGVRVCIVICDGSSPHNQKIKKIIRLYSCYECICIIKKYFLILLRILKERYH